MRINSYDIDIELDFEKAEFRGKEVIHIISPEGKVVLDYLGKDVLAVRSNGKELNFRYDRQLGKVTIETKESKELLLEIEFLNTASDKSIFGFFKSRYNGRYMLVTDFEPDGARNFIPCIDNPSFKASFRVGVTVEKGLKVISNMPVEYVEYLGERERHVFYPTPPMSTYLLFVGVGEFYEYEKQSDGVNYIAASRFNEKERHNFLLDIMEKSVKFFAGYFGIEYPLKKMHWVILPEYLAGAMENWGAITSRERILVSNDSPVSDRIASASTISHEVAHQWFGDLVTMKWWDDLWLNESFATFMELLCLSHYFQEWELEKAFLFEDFSSAMAHDALASTHPIASEIKEPREAHEVFDAISYSKGASVLRMIQDYLGEEDFRKGVAGYLRKYSYSNASNTDFWDTISNVTGKNVSYIMQAWIKKAGFPVVSVERRDGKLILKQNRFTYLGKLDDTWPIPLTLLLDGKKEKLVMDKKELELNFTGNEVRLNPGRKGFYIVNYSQDILDGLLNNYSKLPPEDRFSLIDDNFALLLAGRKEIEDYFKLVSLAEDDSSWLVASSVSEHLFELRSILGEKRILMDKYLSFHRKQIARLGFSTRKGENPRETVARASIASRLCVADEEVSSKLSREISEYDKIDKNLRQAALISYVMRNGISSFNRIKEIVLNSNDERERSDAYSALSLSSERDVIAKTLDLIRNGEIKRSDYLYPIVWAAMNPHARDVLWEWMKENSGILEEAYSGTQATVRIYRSVLPRCAIGREEEVRNFVREKLGKLKLASSEILEMIEVYSNLVRRIGR